MNIFRKIFGQHFFVYLYLFLNALYFINNIDQMARLGMFLSSLEFGHAAGFDHEQNCPSVLRPWKEERCCGDYPERFTYTTNGTENCCGHEIYDTEDNDCCEDEIIEINEPCETTTPFPTTFMATTTPNITECLNQAGTDRTAEGSGDPHYYSFDQSIISYQGNCEYRVVFPKFRILGENPVFGSANSFGQFVDVNTLFEFKFGHNTPF